MLSIINQPKKNKTNLTALFIFQYYCKIFVRLNSSLDPRNEGISEKSFLTFNISTAILQSVLSVLKDFNEKRKRSFFVPN